MKPATWEVVAIPLREIAAWPGRRNGGIVSVKEAALNLVAQRQSKTTGFFLRIQEGARAKGINRKQSLQPGDKLVPANIPVSTRR